jgi:predicted TIM-barrel fold metal-dependent hydrolase
MRNPPDFRTGAELLKHLDRLGVRRSLIYSVQARDQHPATGNRWLLGEIEAADPEWKRLVPALVIAPNMSFERRTREELLRIMEKGRLRALRAFPGSLGYKLHHLEPLLQLLLRFKPTLFLEVREVQNDREISSLAERFPELPIVCVGAMWPQIFNFSLLDLMRREANILTDTSWMHTPTIGSFVELFGRARVLFALGMRAHAGASMAGLAYASVSEADRQAIACGTLESLLGLEPTQEQDAGAGATWRDFLAGTPPAHDIIDAHGHLGASGGWAMREPDLRRQAAEAVRMMDRLGIRTFIVSGSDALASDPIAGNLKLERETAAHFDRLRGYLAFNPVYADELVPRLDDFFSRPFFVGFKLLCDYWKAPVTDGRFEPAYAYANAHRLPILAHTWSGSFDSPKMFEGIVRKYPQASFLLAHCGGPDAGRAEAEELAAANANVYLEWCGSFCARRLWESTLAKVGVDKVIYGSDAMGHDMAWELGRLLSLDVPAAKLRPILGDNMRRLLARRT